MPGWPMAPEERLAAILASLEAALRDLARYETEVPAERLLRDGDASRMVRQALQEAVQSCIDAGEIILARSGETAPETYRGIFLALGDRAGLPADLAEAMAGMAGLRNVLVHMYTTTDLLRVHDAYTGEREILVRFAAWAAAWLSGR